MKKLIKIFYRKPDFKVGDPADPYMLRWWVIPRNKYFNIYLHKFLKDDEDRALHDHPWASLSIILKGRYIEHTPNGFKRLFKCFSFIYRNATYTHRIELLRKEILNPAWCKIPVKQNEPLFVEISRPVWTLFITGPKVREWGFHCPKGFVHWQDFVDRENPGAVGKGCGE